MTQSRRTVNLENENYNNSHAPVGGNSAILIDESPNFETLKSVSEFGGEPATTTSFKDYTSENAVCNNVA